MTAKKSPSAFERMGHSVADLLESIIGFFVEAIEWFAPVFVFLIVWLFFHFLS